jgi:hypothetical protein
MSALDPSKKIAYHDGDKVDVMPSGNPLDGIYQGTIMGPASTPNIIDYWIVKLDTPIPGYPWSAISVGHVFIRPHGSNQPFLCENP